VKIFQLSHNRLEEGVLDEFWSDQLVDGVVLSSSNRASKAPKLSYDLIVAVNV
jgi:hypothetical protein